MIEFDRYKLRNGLTVILHQDKNTQLAAVNVLYKVGSKDDHPLRTGYAHLFEHLMFEGTANAQNFDTVLQNAGGESNAYTNQDLTNYYDILPAENLETALWLEADRMFNLQLTEEKVEIQKRVVVEEFHETCLNVPYGKVWHDILDLSYQNHGYNWPTIGLVPDHISSAKMEDVVAYHKDYYHPSNAILVVAGGFDMDEAKKLIEKHFSQFTDTTEVCNLSNGVLLSNERKVIAGREPANALYFCFHTPNRADDKYYASDILSDVLAADRSSYLYNAVIKDEPLFSDIDAYVTGTIDSGMMIIEGRVLESQSVDRAEAKIWETIDYLQNELITEKERIKLQNKIETNLAFSEVSILNRAMSLAFFEYNGNVNEINFQVELFEQISREEIRTGFSHWLTKEKANVIRYEV